MERVASNILNGYSDTFHAERVANGVGHQVVVKIISEILIKSGLALFNHIWLMIEKFLRPVRDHFSTVHQRPDVVDEPARAGPTLRPRRRR